ncbi:MAG: proline--tRNA ligase, partial [Thermoplasmata archaeon]|nr:proline--tRNA ligase [Thermoplasmata archaeon]
PKKDSPYDVHAYARGIAEELRRAGFRVHVDERDIRPGRKFYDWELKGVPMRIEVGMRDIEENAVIVVKRNTLEKIKVSRTSLLVEVKRILEEIQEELYRKAEGSMKENIFTLKSLQDEAEAYRGIKGIIRTNWCGDMKCAERLEVELDKSFLGFPQDEEPDGVCAVCGREAKKVVYLSKSY